MTHTNKFPISNLIFKLWRIFATGFSFALFGFGALLLGLIFAVLVYPLPLNTKRKQKWVRNSIQRATWLYVRVMRMLRLLTFEIVGEIEHGSQGQLIIANHPTLLDVVFIVSAVPDINCIVKSALWRNPFTFAIVSMAGYIRNDSEFLIDHAARQIMNGQKLIVFPEATRTVDFANLDFKRGASHIALASHCPITPIQIECEPITLRKNQKWYQVPDRPPHFRLEIHPSLIIDDIIDTSREKTIRVRHLTQYLKHYFLDCLGIAQ